MSAKRDQSQRHVFIFDNFYEAYRKERAEKEAALNANRLNKADNEGHSPGLKVEAYRPTEFIAHRITSQETRRQLDQSAVTQSNALENMKNHMSDLKDVQSKLEFLLKEIEAALKK